MAHEGRSPREMLIDYLVQFITILVGQRQRLANLKYEAQHCTRKEARIYTPSMASRSEKAVEPGPRNLAQRATFQSISDVNGAHRFFFPSTEAVYAESPDVLEHDTIKPGRDEG